MNSEIAERYGQGLFELALEENTVKEKKEQIEEILNLMDSNPDIALFFRAVKISKEEKKTFIDDTFGKIADHDVVNFMKLIIDKGRAFWMKDILKEYVKLADDNLGIVKGTVISARPLSEEDLDRIKEALEQNSRKTVILKNHIDPSVIAGIKVIVGSRVTDITMKTKIEDMREALLKGGQA